MNVINNLIKLSTTTSEDFPIEKLDTVFNDILLPTFENYAKKSKGRKIRITDNLYRSDVYNLMKSLFNNEYTIQSLIETEMKPYLEEKGFKVHIWCPKYSVEVSW